MVGLVFATRQEADPFLVQTTAVEVAGKPFPLFRSAERVALDTIVVISGMGKVAAAMAAVHLVMAWRVSVLINAGLCGWLGRADPPLWGNLLRVSTAVEGDCDRFGHAEAPVACDPTWFASLGTARLVTCDRPVFNADWREQLAAIGDLADMEGAAVARVAQHYGVPCAMIKGISDNADENGRQDVARNIDRIATTIAETLLLHLKP
ncbi:hypothetical protein DSCO28_01280 [Desulfosarcina ovata subsp. sediminis]|uniref:Nucleoside phosphorylase domain-containing protein n=1 Tax=Desulfosarcina ovata subsp. sediminis TaxID=885957 RepID=A0A5K7ZC64_9BACT|nr:hypothetical protein [Desulfosarcina ovata]BBO79562.1 hypothetical protein DSCO28_01280 [Desulfosarcina ovata subsp. sediminis]